MIDKIFLIAVIVCFRSASGGSCEDTSFVPRADPEDCSKFFACIRGELKYFTCPSGLHFNPIAHACELPEVAGCRVLNGAVESKFWLPWTSTERSEETKIVSTLSVTTSSEISTSEDTTPSSTVTETSTSEETAPSSTSTETSTSEETTPSSTSSETSTTEETASASTSSETSTSEETTPSPTSSESTSEETTPSSTSSESTSEETTPATTSTETSTSEETTPSSTSSETSTSEGTTPASTSSETSTSEETTPSSTSTETSTSEETTLVSISTTSVTQSPLPECPSEGKHFLPYPGDCNKYIECINGNSFEFNCPPDLHFSPVHLTCEWPEEAGCDPSYTTIFRQRS